MTRLTKPIYGHVPARALAGPALTLVLALLSAVSLRADAPPTSLRIANTGPDNEGLPTFRLNWDASSNATYLVQSTTSLAPGAPWSTVDAVTPADQAGSYQLRLVVTDSTGLSSAPAAFYRLVLPQPQISSVEPAIVAPGLPVDFSVFGQCFPTNAVLQVDGVTQAGAVVLSSSLAMVPAFTPDVPGNYQFSLAVGGVVVSSFNVVCSDALSNPEQVLQGPPTEPPASPSKKDFKGHVTLMKAFDDGSGDNLEGKKDFKGHVTLMKAFEDGGDGESARTHTKTGHVTLMKAFDDGSDDARARPGRGRPLSITVTREFAAGEGGVTPFSGEVQEGDVDLAIPGRGLDFVWARTYHSRLGRFGSGTNGWTFSYDVRCAQNSAGGFDVYDGTGRKDTFTLQPNGTYACPEFFREGTLTGGVFRLTFADTGYWEFNPLDGTATAGKLAHIVDRNGNTMSLNYDTSGRLAQVVDDLGRTNTVAYDPAGRVASITDFTGRSVTYQYYQGQKGDQGGVGDLKSVTSPPVTGTPDGNDFPDGKTTTYTYSQGSKLDRENHLLLTVTDPKGQPAAAFTYELNAASVNYLRCISSQSGLGQTFTYNWALVSRPPGSRAVLDNLVNDPMGNVTESFFDARGRCLMERDYTGRATPGLPVTDTDNRPTGQLRSTDPAYYETQWAWNNDSLCTLATAPGGQQMQYVYQSDFDPATTARKRADCRVVRELASSPVDLDGDGVADVSDRSLHFDYDPRFGSDPTPLGVAIKTKGTGADPNFDSPAASKLVAVKTISWAHDAAQDAAALAFTFKLVAVKTISWAHDDEAPKETVTFGDGAAHDSAASFARKLVAVKTISWAHDDESPKETVTFNYGGSDFARKLVAVKTISWAHDDESPKETVTFEYGGLVAHSSSSAFTSKLMAVNALGNGMAINTKGTGANKNREIKPKGWDGTIKGFAESDYKYPGLHSHSHDPCSADAFVVSATDPRGNLTTGTYDANGNRVKVQFFWDRKSSAERDFAYDTYGQLTVITNLPDANGLRRVDTLAWSQGQVAQCVTDAGGLALTSSFEYDARGNPTRAVDPRGNDCLFTCNALDQCVRAQSPPNISARCATDFAYDANDNLVSCATEVRDAADNLVGTKVDRASYDGLDRLTEVALAIDAARAQTNRFVYDGNNQCVQVLGPDAVSGADPQQTTAYEYDERGLLFRAISAPGSSLAGTNEFSYTANYNPATKKYVDDTDSSKLSVFAYDGFERLASGTDPLGNQAVCFYDANDNPKVVRLFGELNDVPGSAGNVRLAESRFEYDGLDRCFRAHDLSFNPATQSPIGSGDAVSACVLAPNDECVSVTDSLGRTTSFAYDTASRLSSATDARGNITVSVRDQLGNATSVTSTDLPDIAGPPQVTSTAFAYDNLNRCVSASDNVGNTATCAYDSLGRVVRETNPNGNDTTYTYDLLDDCLASTDYAGSSLGSGGLPPTIVWSSSATYDTSSRGLTSTDPNGNITSYAYDSLGNCTTITEADGTQQQLVWSPRSNLIQETDANGTTVSNSYDLCDRIIHRDIAARGAAVATTTFETFAYDGSSRLVLANNDVSSQSFSYDSFGDCTGSSQDGLAQSATYDSQGNQLSLTYPSGRVVSYSYDVIDRVSNIATVAGGVVHPHLAQVAYARTWHASTLLRDGTLLTRIDWNGLVNPANNPGDYGWQQVSRIRHGTTQNPSSLADVTGTYDRMQSKTSQSDAVSGRSLALTYDALDQLVESSLYLNGTPALDTLYSLDAAGNRQHVMTNGATMLPDYAMSSALPPGDFFMNRYTTTPFGAQQYDANGNLVVRASAVSPTFYHYDYADRLVEVDALNGDGLIGPAATFTYDALGNRISKTTYPGVPAAPVTTQYVYGDPDSDNDGILELRQSGSLIDSYIHKLDDGIVLARFDAAGQPQYPLSDDLGNTLALTDAGGTVLERYAYDDYGQPQFLSADGTPLVDSSTGQPVTASPLGNPFLFQGMEWDGETGLLGDGGGNYFDPLPASAIRGKVKSIRDNGTGGRAFEGNNPWSGGGGGGGGGWMKKGTVKFFNDAKGFGMVVGGGSKTHTKTGHVTLMK